MRGGHSSLLLSVSPFNSDITLCCRRGLWNKQPFEQLFNGAHLLAHCSYGFFELRLVIIHLCCIHL